MRFIEEIVVDDFLPTFRSLLADALRERGLTQSEVADLLGISQSAVSKYVHGDVARQEDLLAHRGLEELVERLADGLADGDMSPVQALVETEVFIRELEQGGVLAQIHEDAVPELGDYDDEFAVHDPDSQLRSAERTLASVRRGLSVLENTSGFATLIPAVGSNLVQCLPDAESIEDVAAVPGRILDVKGRATIPADPEFGVSEHVATLLLAARTAGSDARGVLNVRYDDGVVTALRDAGRTVVEFDAEASVEPAVAAALADDPAADVLYHTGAMGIEPVVYLLGDDAVSVAETAREIL
ncbi:thiamine-phosphate synthase family protein [Haloarcula marismortui]|uniref:thiamine-phosphate synthase family protein n=1 Tax=Haloarcula marismortui TaxID=2238 RepID=UPI003C74D1C8